MTSKGLVVSSYERLPVSSHLNAHGKLTVAGQELAHQLCNPAVGTLTTHLESCVTPYRLDGWECRAGNRAGADESPSLRVNTVLRGGIEIVDVNGD